VVVAGSFFNVCVLRPKQQFVNLAVGVSDREEWLSRLEKIGLHARLNGSKRITIRVRPSDVRDNIDALKEIIHDVIKREEAT